MYFEKKGFLSIKNIILNTIFHFQTSVSIGISIKDVKLGKAVNRILATTLAYNIACVLVLYKSY